MKALTLSATILATLFVTGCMGTKQLSSNISERGTIDNKDDIVFPELDKAWQKDGQFPNRENLSKIRPGVAKDELYQLIGRPHFNEANRAREWDYIMKFYQADNSVKICQYKVIFDDKFKGQEFYWLPADCAAYAKPMPASSVATPVMPVIVQAPIAREKIMLEADALFKFDKWKLEDMLPEGRAKLDELATKLIAWEARGDSRVNLTGHTDRYGDDMYNMNLSMLRAQTVRQYLISKGVTSSTLTASGAGRTQPLPHVICDTNAPRAEQIRCLQPNRRVEVDVTVYAFADDGTRHNIRQGDTYQNFNDGK
ncbi:MULTISPECIES: OmpA family protein [Moraxella]|uniref:OmpA family protein n=1 Tax=Moraxella TaxID=475 RepID=UPI001880E932|nr:MULTISPECIES: OmpA family protein [Moraxella]MBE9578608.1 OmpA family protein [Moraxella sp. K1664]MBE9587933.1 OmpA family protein [Moraxella sp. K1630]MBE9596162.1 OmpA family protein [Moraxella sp. K2450]MDH9218507.1 OmpA family protein [Moraxella lacunata]